MRCASLGGSQAPFHCQGITLLEKELIGWKQMGLKVYLTRNMCLLAESRLLAERWTEGLEGITEALAIASQTRGAVVRSPPASGQGRNPIASPRPNLGRGDGATGGDPCRSQQAAKGWEKRAA